MVATLFAGLQACVRHQKSPKRTAASARSDDSTHLRERSDSSLHQESGDSFAGKLSDKQ